MLRVTVLFAALFTAGCITPAPLPTPVSTLELAAPFERTWNAVIDVFASQNLPIATIDKSSGLIVANSMSVGAGDARNWATCQQGILGGPAVQRGEFNVLVRSTATGSTARATARWTYTSDGVATTCPTTGRWEAVFHLDLKQAIEGKP